jgi:hypothetical protein
MMGTMTSYVGSIDEDGWRKRVEENYNDPLELDAAGGPLAVKRRKLTPSQISGMCGDEDLDPSLDKNRKKVGKMHEKNILQD